MDEKKLKIIFGRLTSVIKISLRGNGFCCLAVYVQKMSTGDPSFVQPRVLGLIIVKEESAIWIKDHINTDVMAIWLLPCNDFALLFQRQLHSLLGQPSISHLFPVMHRSIFTSDLKSVARAVNRQCVICCCYNGQPQHQ
jgi:hypothetical protein